MADVALRQIHLGLSGWQIPTGLALRPPLSLELPTLECVTQALGPCLVHCPSSKLLRWSCSNITRLHI
ncbi:hypothetical protein C1H46_040718 [Malus baccata]|uniref:Uncharacterized protein n=1 Tax=Malus baccata TaxID=106549 RepID=A0A540KHS9_MALBA|nr:hypothetical protein C1H46_040718 [Malus baccata]